MQKNEKDVLTWAKKYIGEEGMQELMKIAVSGLEFELEFLKNPGEFCAVHQFKVYMGFGPGRNLDKTYVFVYQKDIDLFAVVWMYPNGDTPAYVVGRKVLQNFINRFNFGFIDNEIFLLWLNENKDIIQTAYQKCKEKYEKIMELQNS